MLSLYLLTLSVCSLMSPATAAATSEKFCAESRRSGRSMVFDELALDCDEPDEFTVDDVVVVDDEKKQQLRSSGTFSVLRRSTDRSIKKKDDDYTSDNYDDEEMYDDGDDGGVDYIEEELDYQDDFMIEEADDYEEEKPFKIIPKDEIETMVNDSIQKAVDLLSLDEEYAALVLQYFSWNLDKLSQEYWDNPDECVSKAGVLLNPVEFTETRSVVPCLVCLDDVQLKDSYTLPCGHRFYCFSCWSGYLSATCEMSGSAMVTNTTCMAPNCKIRIGRVGFKKLASPQVYERFNYFFIKSYIDTNKNLTYCPNPNCGNAVKFSGSGKPNDVVECTCGKRFWYVIIIIIATITTIIIINNNDTILY
eukprot:TRINITY_DN2153_c0_g1_i9.p1 TRINITY_DN2153_c0_g1~~TRINITY_DN2153_c0_g1_i9.p1  ORF type:complete len:363 (-),score=100.34 TRINITY_DN2153_c0_g1_i9:2-1090(-)